MARILSFLLLLYLLSATAVSAPTTTRHHSGTYCQQPSASSPSQSPECRGTIAECLAGDEEFDLGSESSRRILATRRYISYNALRRDSIPCSRRGASYYNCRPGAQANPYSRGCSRITRCRS
ncbi:LOW QUALITY PROTEIN: rapid alkalinization factor-like [Asparagus officinalis]|uniref:LOW QUALITY PROTEIN: rapid alkalinization factor-like n=1 Tax=Asparagus officinalis TaxID=4686 RepID=UPI00098E4689|nr:LOW QUALITY PROTEIN: rapid alkalinization factor-like [Asparagus officinalis]